MIERQLDVKTPDGATTTFIVHPDREGPHPVVIFLMDAPAIREELRDMARRIATVGYYVMLPNLYYREGVMELGEIPFGDDDTSPARQRMFQLAGSLSIPMVMRDVGAMIDFADDDPAAKKGRMAAIGYCLSGRFALYSAVAYADRVAAAASLYGTRFITDRPNSPHLAFRDVSAELYLACAEHDRFVPMKDVEILRSTLTEGGVNFEIEIYPGVHHGFAFPERPAYDKPAAEQHWSRLFSLFRRRLA